MANIKFNYLYRDGGNYKNYGSVVLANSTGLGLAELSAFIRSKLIDQTWFYAADAGIPDLTPNTFNPETDPTWYEFENIEFADDAVDAKIDVLDLVELLRIEI